MIGLPKGLVTFNHNQFSVVDTETTGLTDGYHDLIQVAVLPLSEDLDPSAEISPFYCNIRPDYPARATKQAMEKNGLDMDMLMSCPGREEVAEMFDEWYQDLCLPLGKRLIWLTHNATHDIPFMRAWLGDAGFHRYFYWEGRDSLRFATSLNDAAAWKARPVPFPDVGLKGLCKKFGIRLDNHHDALADCIATGYVYRELLRWE